MDWFSMILLAVASVTAGAINAAVGSGSLLTLPVLMALGLTPGTAVRTNTVGMVFSTIGSVAGFRREISAERRDLGPVSVAALVGAIGGSLLLLRSSPDALDIVVPILIAVALVMVITQPRVTARIRARGQDTHGSYRKPGVVVPILGASVYGGFFTAAQGVLYVALLALGTGRTIKDVNPVKNWLSLLVNVAAAGVYLIAHVVTGAEIHWIGALVVGIGSLIGGYFGAHIAKRLPDRVLRGVIVVVAVVALIRQFVGG